ncbi:MAG TPA: hypothetical protein VEJ00_11795 [Candidatus Acidoferrales bacterium]|jgi:hypothetical protein|nr:hypothetical protein [Candidatus Acidoferrales bacterium]
MPSSRAQAVIAHIVLCILASAAQAQTKSKPLFSEPLSLCSGHGFVAMAPFSWSESFVVVMIDEKGIEAPKTIQTPNNGIIGLQCLGSHLELHVREDQSDHSSVLPYAIRDGKIEPEPREDINWSISGKGPMPSAVERRSDGFGASAANAATRGDWYELVCIGVNHIYELHRVFHEIDGVSKFRAELVEETFDHKVTKALPLVYYERAEHGD